MYQYRAWEHVGSKITPAFRIHVSRYVSANVSHMYYTVRTGGDTHMYYETSHCGCPGGVGSRVASRPTLYLIHVFQMYIHLETVVETRHRVIHLRNTCIMCRRKLTSTGGTQMHTARALIHVCHRSCNHNTCITNVSRCRDVDTCINIVYHRRYMLAHSPSCSMVSHVESSHDARWYIEVDTCIILSHA